MKNRTRLIIIYMAIGLSVAMVTAYFIYQYRKSIWCEYATKAFVGVLSDNLKERGIKDVPFYNWGVRNDTERKNNLKKDSFVNVTLICDVGNKLYRTYRIPYYKDEHNIESNKNMRIMQSYILQMNPLNEDSLNIIWSNKLKQVNFSGRSMICISVTDLFENETKKISDNAFISKIGNCIFHIYIGLRSEIEISGYIYLPWWKSFNLSDILFLCGIIIFSLLFPLLMKYIADFYRNYFLKREVITIEKEIHVIVADKGEVHTYQLDEGIIFDYDTKSIRNNEKTEELTTQQADLLQLFLNVNNYLLTTSEIADALWPNSIDAKNNIYSAIKRLRISLSHISKYTIENRDSKYQLKIPHSIAIEI